MLLINKSLSANTIVCTVTECTTVDNPVYRLVIHSDFTHKSFSIQLGENLSSHLSRYDMFSITADKYSDIEDGKCTYAIYQNEDDSLQPVEIGYILIMTAEPSVEFVAIEEQETEDDFIIYSE